MPRLKDISTALAQLAGQRHSEALQEEFRALDKLKALDLKNRRAKYHSVPDYAIHRQKFESKTANGLTSCILRWLQLHDHWATRINTTGRYLKGETVTDVTGKTRHLPGQWIPGTTRKGTADIHAILWGRHVSIEVKVGKDRLSQAQRDTKQEVEQAGGVYLVARSFSEFLTWYGQSRRDSNAGK